MIIDNDINLALDFVAIAIDPDIPYTVAVERIADRIRELFQQFEKESAS
jgi:hypothetical protein